MTRFAFILLLCILTLPTVGQANKEKTFETGFNIGYQYPYRIGLPGRPLITGAYLKYQRHEIHLAADIYNISLNIYGFQGNYRFHFPKNNHQTNIFVGLLFNYATHGVTSSYDITNYNDNFKGIYPVVSRNKTLAYTLGIGGQTEFAKRFIPHIFLGYGINRTDIKSGVVDAGWMIRYGMDIEYHFAVQAGLKIRIIKKMCGNKAQIPPK